MPDIEKIIEEIPGLEGASVLTELAGGPNSNSYHVISPELDVVIRIDNTQAQELKLDRNAEREVLQTVAAAKIGPELIWVDPARGIQVTSFIPGDAWTIEQIHDPENLRQLAEVLRQLHSLRATGPQFNPTSAALAYASSIGTHQAMNLARQVKVLAKQLLTQVPGRLCHNDLVHRNIIATNPPRLIDWEYAAIGDPLFDLAVVIRHHDLPETPAESFLEAYFSSVDLPTLRRLESFFKLYDLISALWYLAAGTDLSDLYATERDRVLSRIKYES